MIENLFSLAQFWVYLALVIASLIYLGFSAFFGGDDHDADHSHGGETVTFMSPKIVAAFVCGFGAAGAIATAFGCNVVWSSLIGIGVGFILGLIAMALLRLMYGQQASSDIRHRRLLRPQIQRAGRPSREENTLEVDGYSCTIGVREVEVAI